MSMLYKVVLYIILTFFLPVCGFCTALPQLPQASEFDISGSDSTVTLPSLPAGSQHTKPATQSSGQINGDPKLATPTTGKIKVIDAEKLVTLPAQVNYGADEVMNRRGPSQALLPKAPMPNSSKNKVVNTPAPKVAHPNVITPSTSQVVKSQVPSQVPAAKVTPQSSAPVNSAANQVVKAQAPNKVPTNNTPLAPVSSGASNKVSTTNAAIEPSEQNNEQSKKQANTPIANTTTHSTEKAQTKEQKNTNLVDEDDHANCINNEAIMLTIRDDDVVLGEVTPASRIDDMTAQEYIHKFWDDYNASSNDNLSRKRDITLFVDGRNTYRTLNDMNLEDIKNDLFESIKKNRIDDARTILDNAPLLQSRDKNGANLLGVAVLTNDTDVAKFLLHRGVNMNAMDYQGNTPFNIAEDVGHLKMQRLLNRSSPVRRYGY